MFLTIQNMLRLKEPMRQVNKIVGCFSGKRREETDNKQWRM